MLLPYPQHLQQCLAHGSYSLLAKQIRLFFFNLKMITVILIEQDVYNRRLGPDQKIIAR